MQGFSLNASFGGEPLTPSLKGGACAVQLVSRRTAPDDPPRLHNVLPPLSQRASSTHFL